MWLDGKASLVKTLLWPVDDPFLTKHAGTRRRREGWSLMDDLVMYWIAFLPSGDTEPARTIVYKADLVAVRNMQSQEVRLQQFVELNYVIHRLAVVPNLGFATAEWKNATLHFRACNSSGALVREQEIPAQAAYGDLSIYQSTVSLCITSMEPPAPEWLDIPSHVHYLRLDYLAGYTTDLPRDLAADTIATWNMEDGSLSMVKIPQTQLGRIEHSADFQYIHASQIVLASSLAFNPKGAVLSSFSTAQDGAGQPLKFYEGQHTDPHSISNYLGHSSTAVARPIVVHNHDSGSRITVFRSEILTGDIPSKATTRDPPGLREAFQYPNESRTLGFALSKGPSISGTRVLVHKMSHDGCAAVYMLDFDQDLVASLLAKSDAERREWDVFLKANGSQIKIVTRRFYHSVDGEIYDQEYLWPQEAPQEWQAHLDTIMKSESDEELSDNSDDEGVEKQLSGVEYDEAPEEHRSPMPFGYVQTAIHLGEGVKWDQLAMTPHALVELPHPTHEGRIVYFD